SRGLHDRQRSSKADEHTSRGMTLSCFDGGDHRARAVRAEGEISLAEPDAFPLAPQTGADAGDEINVGVAAGLTASRQGITLAAPDEGNIRGEPLEIVRPGNSQLDVLSPPP